MKKRLFIVLIFCLFCLIFISIANVKAQITSSSYQTIGTPTTSYYNPSFSSTLGYTSPSVFWPEFDEKTCKEREDFIVQIAPAGCQPSVVRSDLLEESTVPVFCKLMLIQANPLIDTARVRSITFPGKVPEGVAGISYFPSNVNLISRKDLASTPIDDNMGYFVVNLKRQKTEKEMPEWIGGNLTAVIDYDIENALGMGRAYFYLPEMDYEEWARDYQEYSFWKGKGYVKVDSIESDRVTVSIYRDMDTKLSTFTLKKGETSAPVYLPGFYCAAALNVKLENMQNPVESALLQIDGKQIWVAKNDKILDGKCSIKSLESLAGGGRVSISCSGVKEFNLRLNPGKITLNKSEVENPANSELKESFIGSEVEEGVYLGYVGTWPPKKQEAAEKVKFAVFVFDSYSSNEKEFADKGVYGTVEKIVNNKANENKKLEDIETQIKKEIVSQYKIKLKSKEFTFNEKNITLLKEKGIGMEITKNQQSYTLKLVEIQVIANENWEAGENEEKLLAYEYYKKATENYKDLADLYPNEKKINENYFESYAVEGLYNAAKLAGLFNMLEDKEEFLSRLYREYPDSAWTRRAESDKLRLLRYDSSDSRAVVNLRDGSYFFELLEFKKPRKEDISVNLLIDGEAQELGLDEIWISENEKDKKASIQVTGIFDEYVTLKYESPTLKESPKTATLNLDEKKQTMFENINVKLVNINLKKQAKLSLDSTIKGTRALANFSFKIGIEKRAIKLSPEKTKEMLENIQESIKKWESINEKLGKVVKGLKTACFATSAVLAAKSLVTGFSGKALARTEVMTKAGGWNDYCARIASNKEASKFTGKTYSSIESCLLGHNSEIEKDVSIYAQQIEAANKKLEAARQGIKVEKTDILDFQGGIDRIEMEKRYKEQILKECASWGGIKLPEKIGATGEPEDGGVFNTDYCSTLSFEDLKEISTLYNIQHAGGSSVLQNSVEADLARVALDAQTYQENEEARKKAAEELKTQGITVRQTLLDGNKVILANIDTVTQAEKSISYSKFTEIGKGDKIMSVFIPQIENFGGSQTFKAESPEFKNGGYAIVKLKESTKGVYVVNTSYTKDGSTSTEINKDVIDYLALKKATQFKPADATAYHNKIANPEKLQVKYFEKAPYKGMPAEVPFDTEEGWYVEMEYVLSGFGKPYDESGRVVNFYICNVGPNNLIEFKRKADDICRYYNGVSDELDFPGMDSAESRNIVSRAKNAIIEAAKQYGKRDIFINGKKFSAGTSFGGESGACSDFMSPSDCNIMFNVCDPVICPSSRCNLGGEFQVDNVIQTGIIGSIVLCLPNIKEGIFIPVCLSGIHAGIEGYLSILKAEQDCLNESLATGRNIGICDEITSIYLCDFFWKQLAPFANVLIPKLIESFFSQGTRGGGEYLTVQASWDNTQKAIDYFKNDYAVNSMTAFNMRSTEEAGTEVCKSFISTRYPTDLDLLTEPDSPMQYHAYFDENVMTTTTPYPTSHYKVYYHIYAGKDQGAYFIVYLKDIAEEFASVYTHTTQQYVVDRGYLAKGSYADQAKDFIAPSGYKQLCININGQDECGFGKVSTSFAVNYLSDEFAAEQAEQQIKTSAACIAGTPSLYSFAQPNLQAGAEEFVQPELYNQGITRVCSTYNPGKQVEPTGEYDTTNSTFDRWKDVGHCDDETIRCWLDTESAKDVIKDKKLEQQVLSTVDTSIIGQKGYLTPEKSIEIANEAESFIDKLDINNTIKTETAINKKIESTMLKLEELSTYSSTNAHRANGLFLLGKLYDEVATQIILGIKVEPITANKEAIPPEEQGVKKPGEEISCKGELERDAEPKIIGTTIKAEGKIWTRLGKEDDSLWESEDGTTKPWIKIQPPIILCETGSEEVEPTETPERKFTLAYTDEETQEIRKNGEGTGFSIINNKIILKLSGETYIVGEVDSNKLYFDLGSYEILNNPEMLELGQTLDKATISGSKLTLASETTAAETTTSEPATPTSTPTTPKEELTTTTIPEEKFIFELRDLALLSTNKQYRYAGSWQISSDKGVTWSSVDDKSEFYKDKFWEGAVTIREWVNSRFYHALTVYFNGEVKKYSNLNEENFNELRNWINSKSEEAAKAAATTADPDCKAKFLNQSRTSGEKTTIENGDIIKFEDFANYNIFLEVSNCNNPIKFIFRYSGSGTLLTKELADGEYKIVLGDTKASEEKGNILGIGIEAGVGIFVVKDNSGYNTLRTLGLEGSNKLTDTPYFVVTRN